MKTRKPLQRKTPMRRTWMKRKPGKPMDALGRWLKVQPCVCCGKPGPSDGAHLSLSRDQKGMGMKVPECQRAPLCRKCHQEYDQRRGRFAGWSDDERYATARGWITVVELSITPGDRNHALELQGYGLGTLEGDRWTPSAPTLGLAVVRLDVTGEAA